MSALPIDAEDRLRTQLLPGERVLWSGRPDPRVLFTSADAFIIPFSLVWCGFAVFWTVGVLRSAHPAFAAFGLIFVLFGLYLVVGRFIVKSLLKRRAVYAVTDRRLLVLTGPGSVDQSPVAGQPMTVTRRGAHVSVVLGPQLGPRQTMYANTGLDVLNRRTGGPALYDVADVEPLLSALRRAQAS